jgi:hypothetical protein
MFKRFFTVSSNDDMSHSPKKFEAARMKLRRARKHIAELEDLVTKHIAKHPIGIKPYHFRSASHPGGRLVTPPVPPDAPVILGDIIHNTRTSLDLMASEMARKHPKSDSGVHFPFSEDELQLTAQINRKKFDRCGPNAIALLRTLKPYKGGNLKLRALHDLDVLGSGLIART